MSTHHRSFAQEREPDPAGLRPKVMDTTPSSAQDSPDLSAAKAATAPDGPAELGSAVNRRGLRRAALIVGGTFASGLALLLVLTLTGFGLLALEEQRAGGSSNSDGVAAKSLDTEPGLDYGEETFKGRISEHSGALASTPAQDASEASAQPDTTALGAQVISTGHITVMTKDATEAADLAETKTLALGGRVSSRDVSVAGAILGAERAQSQRTRLVVRVPAKKFRELSKYFEELGKVAKAQTSSEDVTQQVIDTASRIRSQERSLERLRTLLGKAKSLNQIILLENELTHREADLAALRQTRDYLEDQTAMSTITLSLREPNATVDDDEPSTGFGAGFRRGWAALGSVTVGALTALGVVLPFAVVGGLLAVPCWLLWRRRARNPSQA